MRLFTSANSIVPLASQNSHRAICAIDKLRLYDPSPDEDADTESGTSPFMTQSMLDALNSHRAHFRSLWARDDHGGS